MSAQAGHGGSVFDLYSIPQGMHEIPKETLDLRPDDEIDIALLKTTPVTNEKNVWFYWHQGYSKMHPYTQRNVRAWYRRLSKRGWSIRVVDRVKGSAHNIDQFLDVNDPKIFPQAYIDNTLTGVFATQHCSDLIRFPLLIRYGGIYADVGFLQIGDIDRLWNDTIANPDSSYEVLSYNGGKEDEYCLTNYFLATHKDNPLFRRFQSLLLALWSAEGGQVETTGMHKSPLLSGTPLLDCPPYEDNGRKISPPESNEILTDYIIQGQAMRMVMSMVDPEDNWDGPNYTTKHVFAIEFMEGSQLINQLTSWNGEEAYRLLSLPLPLANEAETSDQIAARDIVEQCLSRSFGFKLATGMILKVLGETLSSQWRRHVGSDDVPGTYAHWLRYGMLYWTQDQLPARVKYEMIQPFKVGPLTRAV